MKKQNRKLVNATHLEAEEMHYNSRRHDIGKRTKHKLANSSVLLFARLFIKVPRPGNSKVTLRSSIQAATSYYFQSNHSKIRQSR